ncbi:MAG TPA: DUF6338 family protein [Solirubrobacterales bacterium]|nr:DUF6338 family protein [Solirubrobacterales bacterium]
MPDTFLGLAIAIAFVLPGFITADLAESRRATRAARSDLELVLRGLVYALIIQAAVAATGWTETIIDDVTGSSGSQVAKTEAWTEHLPELVTFGLVVGILIPTILGLLLSEWLRRAEQCGQLKFWHYAAGGRDYRKAWDFVFGRQEGTFLLVTVAEDDGVKHFLGKYGPDSWATQAPTQPPELYLEEAWAADEEGFVDQETLDRKPSRGMWVAADKVDRLEILHL